MNIPRDIADRHQYRCKYVYTGVEAEEKAARKYLQAHARHADGRGRRSPFFPFLLVTWIGLKKRSKVAEPSALRLRGQEGRGRDE